MRSYMSLFLLLVFAHNAYCSYLAIAPKVFHPGWKYAVQLTVVNAQATGIRMTVTGNIFNGKMQSLGAGTVTFENGQSAILEIPVGANIPRDPHNEYSLQLDGSGALRFSNSSFLKMAPLSRLAFIQADKAVYTTGQLVRFRVVIVNEDLLPLYIPKNITIQNPMESTIARFYCNGSKAVYENTYLLADFPDLGTWYIGVQSSEGNIDERIKIRVVENESSKFEVSAEVIPDLLIKESNDQRFVTVSVTARDMEGKGVKGNLKVTVLIFNKIVETAITEPSGEKDVDVDLTRELAAVRDHLRLLVEVKDATGRVSSTKVTVHVQERPVRVYFDIMRTDRVYRTNRPWLAVLKVTDARGQALSNEDLTNEVVMTLTDRSNQSNSLTRRVTLTPGQTEVLWNLTKINSTTPQLYLAASFVVEGRKYEANETIRKYMVLGNGTLNARWIGLAPNLTMGGVASFVVDECMSANFTAVTYMILSRGNIQDYGRATPGQQVNVAVTPEMCPKGRLVVYGLTDVTSSSDTPELIADSLYLTTNHCQGKRVSPRLTSNSQEAGSNVALSLDVEWTDPNKQQTTAVDHHDVYVMAIDKRVIDRQGSYDVSPARVEEGLNRFVMNATEQQVEETRINPTTSHPPPTSTGELLESLGLTLLGDVNLLNAGSISGQVTNRESTEDDNSLMDVSERTDFLDTWLWKTGRTDDRGKLTLVETLPDTAATWVVSAFAVRKDTELAITSEPLELNAVNPFYVRLSLPLSARVNEKLEVRATVFNFDIINMDTTVTLAPSDNYIISGSSTQTTMVRRNEASTVIFTIVAGKVGTHSIQATATARRSNGGPITGRTEQQLTVKPDGVKRTKTFTMPVILSASKVPYDRNVTLDLWPWNNIDLVGGSRNVQVMVTGNVLGSVLHQLERLVMLPMGCGEQNLLSMAPSVHALTYLTHANQLHADFAARAKDNVRTGYARQVQQYRWQNGGFSAFGSKDQSASTWLTALVLKTFAQARPHVPETVDMDILTSALSFLYTRQNTGTGQFFERGRALQEEMQDGASGTLSVFVTMCLLEAKKHGIKIEEERLVWAMNYVKSVGNGQAVRDDPFLASLTAYALTLDDPKSYITQDSVVRLIGYVENKGAPWQRAGLVSDGPHQSWRVVKPSTRDVQVTSYLLLTLNAITKFTKARELLLWLMRNQNCHGGFRSTQDTLVAVQAMSEHAANMELASAYNDVVITALAPSTKPRSLHIDSTNAVIQQTVELDQQTSKVNIYVTGDANTLAVVKVVFTFHTPPDRAMNTYTNNNHRKLVLGTRTTMERPGIYNVQACINPESGLQYTSMVVLCLTLPSGFVPKDLRQTRTRNPAAVRVAQQKNMVLFYMNQPFSECINLKIEEKVKIDDLRPGYAALFAYYMPDMMSEASIHIGCSDGSCSTDAAVTGTQLSLALLVVACFLALFPSLVFVP